MSLFPLTFAVRTSSNSKYSPMVFDVMAFRGVMPSCSNIFLSSLLMKPSLYVLPTSKEFFTSWIVSNPVQFSLCRLSIIAALIAQIGRAHV